MNAHSTNYFNPLIETAENCPVSEGKVSPVRGSNKTIANYQFELILDHPYEYSSDDVIFMIYSIRKGIEEAHRKAARKTFFQRITTSQNLAIDKTVRMGYS